MRASGKSNEDLNYDFHQIHQLKHPKGLDFWVRILVVYLEKGTTSGGVV